MAPEARRRAPDRLLGPAAFERLSPRQVDRLFDAVRAGGIDDALLRRPTFLSTGTAATIASLLKYRVITSALDVARLPFGLTGKPRRV